MAKNTRIALTGFMGVGKSSVARHLANMLKSKKIDLDAFIEKNEQRKIAEIIDADGEAKYRDIESKNLKDVLTLSEIRVRIIVVGAKHSLPKPMLARTFRRMLRPYRWKFLFPTNVY